MCRGTACPDAEKYTDRLATSFGGATRWHHRTG